MEFIEDVGAALVWLLIGRGLYEIGFDIIDLLITSGLI